MTSWDEQVARIERMRPKTQPLVNQPKPVEPDDGSEFGKGVKAGLYQTAAVGPALVSMAGKAVGSDSVAEWGAEKAGGLMEKASEYEGETSFEELFDQPTLAGATNWVMHTAGTLLPTMIVGMGGAGIGAKVAGRMALKKVTQDMVTKNAARFLAAGATKEQAVKLAAKQLVAKATKYGAGAGIVGATAPMEAAHNFMTDVDQHGIENASPGKAAVTGTAAGLVEVAFGGGHLRLINKVLGGKVGKSAATSLSKGIKDKFAKVVKEAVIQGGGEGLQELTQEELSILNEIWTGEDQSLFEKKNLLRAGESFAAGAIMGVPAGGVTGAFNKAPVDNSGDATGEGDTGTKVKGRTIDLGDIPGPQKNPIVVEMERRIAAEKEAKSASESAKVFETQNNPADVAYNAFEDAGLTQTDEEQWLENRKQNQRKIDALYETEKQKRQKREVAKLQRPTTYEQPVDELSVTREMMRDKLRKSPDERGRETQGASQARNIKAIGPIEAERMLNEHERLNLPMDPKLKAELQDIIYQSASPGQRINRQDVDYSKMERKGTWAENNVTEPVKATETAEFKALLYPVCTLAKDCNGLSES